MALEPIDDHFNQAIVALVPAFWGKPVIAALLWSYVKQVQQLEDAAWEVINAFDVRTCDATRLAVLGRVVGQPNFGWGLETYRAVVKAKIAANRSRGTEDDILRVLRLIVGNDGDITITTYAPAAMRVEFAEPITDDAVEAIDFLLPRVRSAGVQLHLVLAPAAAPDRLTWASSVTGGGGDFASSVSGGGDPAYSVHLL